jgi:methylated-DNA-[protein]-cysteine S-methyltransferase
MRDKISLCYYRSPYGLLEIRGSTDQLFSVSYRKSVSTRDNEENRLTSEVVRQLDEYFRGLRRIFNLPLCLENYTSYQLTIWKLLSEIPFGETRSYSDIARQVGNSLAARAVGNACGQNPFLLIVPCHRVVRKDGTPGGFSAGLLLKQQLLKMESKLL